MLPQMVLQQTRVRVAVVRQMLPSWTTKQKSSIVSWLPPPRDAECWIVGLPVSLANCIVKMLTSLYVGIEHVKIEFLIRLHVWLVNCLVNAHLIACWD